MDNNSFEQQFAQNLKTTAVTPVAEPQSGSKLPLVVAIALAAVTLVETIVLIITLSNYFSLVNNDLLGTGDYEEPVDDDLAEYDNYYTYNSDNNLTAMNLICTSQNGDKYTTNLSNNYTFTSSDGTTNSGTYTITNDSLIQLSGSNKVVFYDGFSIADGLTIYECEEPVAE